VITLEAPAETQVPGWFHHGPKILALVDRYKPVVCVELGTFLGASAIPVARSIARWRGVLTCVDTWSVDVYHEGQTSPWLLLGCARNLAAAGVTNVRLMPASTLAAADTWTEPIDYLYVDADHSEEAVRSDLLAWAPHVRPGGLILGDDYGNRWFPGVQRAWDDFEAASGVTLTRYQSRPPHPDSVQLIYGIKESHV
jgi:hypothetical protein